MILLIALHLAARKNEIYSLTWNDIDFDGKKVRIWTNKRDGGQEPDWLPMTKDLELALKEQRFKTGFQEYVLINEHTKTRYTWRTGMMQRLCEKAGVKYFGLHGIRHLAACLLDEAGEPLAYIQGMLRHRSATTTTGQQQQQQVSNNNKRLFEIFERY